MASNINTTNIDENFPYPGVDNDTQGFRTNFDSIKASLNAAKLEISDLQDGSANIFVDNDFGNNTISNVVLQDVKGLKFAGGVIDTPVEINYNNGLYQLYRFTDNSQITLAGFSSENYTKLTLELTGGGGSADSIENLTPGKTYRITAVGNSDFTTVGAESNTVGTYFTATGTGTGTGIASVVQVLTFATGGATIKRSPGFPNPLIVESSVNPTIIEIWTHNSSTIFMNSLGTFTN